MIPEFEVSYHSDVFIKYAMSRNDEGSIYIRHSIIRYVTGIQPKESIVLNPELDATIINQKSIILDVHVKDEEGREFDIEMQISGIRQSLQKRFEYYGVKMLAEQLSKGDDYEELKPVYQIIFLNAFHTKKSKLIEHYQMRDEDGNEEYAASLLHRSYIYLSYINELVKEKGISHLNEFEQACYLLENDANHAILELKEGLVKKLMEKHEQMKDDRSIWSIARSQEIRALQDKYLLRDYYNDGKAEGIAEGKAEGKTDGYRKLLICQIESRFHINAQNWIQTLTEEELIRVAGAVLISETFDDLTRAV